MLQSTSKKTSKKKISLTPSRGSKDQMILQKKKKKFTTYP